MFKIYALTNDRARLLAHQAETDDLAAARMLAPHYAERGYFVRICAELEGWGRDEVIEEYEAA